MEIVDKKNRCIICGRENSVAPNSISLFCDFQKNPLKQVYQLLTPRTPATIIVDIHLIFITQALLLQRSVIFYLLRYSIFLVI